MIKVKNLHAHYGKSHILKGIDLDLKEGEIIGLIGRNGMGKTTFLRTLAGLKSLSKGNIQIFGKESVTLAPHQISQAGISYVPEKRGIFPNLTVWENLVMASRSRLNGESVWGLDDVLANFPQLNDRLNNGGHQLSGGEQQILAICRAFLTNPEFILIDEATEGLAPMVARDIWKILGEISSKSVGAIIVDKDLDALSRIAKRCVVMMNGQLVFDGSTKNLKNNSELRKKFLGI